jgi:hypothetical protein
VTIHEMLQQVALLSSGVYRRDKNVSSLEIPLPRQRKQIMYGLNESIRGEPVGLLYTHVGVMNPAVDAAALLTYNAKMQYGKIALLPNGKIIIIVMFDPVSTSIKECAPMLQEMAAVADELERIYFTTDEM